jgi:hypothetical protein
MPQLEAFLAFAVMLVLDSRWGAAKSLSTEPAINAER